MNHKLSNEELAKQKLARATTATDRQEAIKFAIQQGMPLNAIEQFMDWLQANAQSREKTASNDASAAQSQQRSNPDTLGSEATG